MIGDLGSAGLVGRDGSIDWLCWPRFDSDACFAALLGKPDHGRWQIAPQARAVSIRRRYRPDTLILETRFETEDGAATLIDFTVLYTRTDWSDPAIQERLKAAEKCEVLVPELIPLSHIRNI